MLCADELQIKESETQTLCCYIHYR